METMSITIPVWKIEKLTGYKPISTFWQDFSIAEKIGSSAIIDTYNRVFKEWKHDYKMITELSMVLKNKIDYCFDNDDFSQYMELYDKLWNYCFEWVSWHLKGEEFQYYISH